MGQQTQTWTIRDPFAGELEVVGTSLKEAIEAVYGDIAPAVRPAYVWHADQRVKVPGGRNTLGYEETVILYRAARDPDDTDWATTDLRLARLYAEAGPDCRVWAAAIDRAASALTEAPIGDYEYPSYAVTDPDIIWVPYDAEEPVEVEWWDGYVRDQILLEVLGLAY